MPKPSLKAKPFVSDDMSIEQAIEDAEDNAGDGNVDDKPPACSRLNIGIFFDGTYNSRNVAGKPGYNAASNVDLLEPAYIEDTFVKNGCNIKSAKEYIVGIGIDEAGNKDALDALNGGGNSGVAARVGDGLKRAGILIEELSQGEPQIEILLDVFGFSRGAAAARHFANKIKEGALKNYGKVRVRFLGIFDTVGSVGIPGNSIEPGINLNTSGVADHIVHIFAKDEYRKYFPCTLAQSGNIGMIGDHSDIGGGHNEDIYSGTFKTSNFKSQDIGRLINIIENDWLDRSCETFSYKYFTSVMGELEYNWTAGPGLSDVAKAVMYDKAISLGVPFVEGLGFKDKLPDDLKILYSSMMRGSYLRDDQEKRIRQNYAHFGENSIPNARKKSWRRTYYTK